jgi:cytochrome c biogenesis protein CcmG, thiol:disulfide interchange protein DsbE
MKKIILLCLLVFGKKVFAQENTPKVFIKDIKDNVVLFSEVVKNDSTVLVVLWATWCGPCINELDNLKIALKSNTNKKIKVVAVSIDDSRTSNKAKNFAKAKRWTFDIFLDPNNDLMRALNVSNPPYSCVIKNNTITYAKTGYIEGSETELLKKCDK